MHPFRRLDVWRDAVDLATRVYRLTGTYPAAERYGLTAQMRRAVVSVSSNIAEGAGRGSSRDMARFLRVAIGSICELESQLEESRELGLVTDVEDLISKASLLRARIKTLEDRLLIPDTSGHEVPDTSYLNTPPPRGPGRGAVPPWQLLIGLGPP